MSDFRIGKFKILGTLGTGAHSTILHVRREADSKPYALKVVPIDGADDQKYLEQARHEYRVGQLLGHRNLIQIHALETQSDWLFRVKKVHLLIEYVDGKTLDALPPMGVPKLLQIFLRVAEGMSHMHRRGVLHADLKPNNIMLSRAGQVKVIDYGLAWIKSEPKGRIQGTPEYLAPETVNHQLVNERTDIFNFGATMYRLSTWKFPPRAIAQAGIPMNGKTWKGLLVPPRELNPKVPIDLSELILKCLEYDANARPERMSEIQGTLDHLVEELVRTDDKLEALE
jgi:serine/threonine protein kinase